MLTCCPTLSTPQHNYTACPANYRMAKDANVTKIPLQDLHSGIHSLHLPFPDQRFFKLLLCWYLETISGSLLLQSRKHEGFVIQQSCCPNLSDQTKDTHMPHVGIHLRLFRKTTSKESLRPTGRTLERYTPISALRIINISLQINIFISFINIGKKIPEQCFNQSAIKVELFCS